MNHICVLLEPLVLRILLNCKYLYEIPYAYDHMFCRRCLPGGVRLHQIRYVRSVYGTGSYMKDTYVTSAGEIHCLSEDDWAEYKLFIDNGGIPVLSFDPDPISDV